ncbi:hypothetical protein E5288_WYG014170 [Bos mutus]|uniref:Uncharacterized protein n=1 Tax=Bos mutus TaxID=72004 RepID=A0A6B0R5G7_9CETA|nr:hypothetical protein [Bos mutus]
MDKTVHEVEKASLIKDTTYPNLVYSVYTQICNVQTRSNATFLNEPPPSGQRTILNPEKKSTVVTDTFVKVLIFQFGKAHQVEARGTPELDGLSSKSVHPHLSYTPWRLLRGSSKDKAKVNGVAFKRLVHGSTSDSVHFLIMLLFLTKVHVLTGEEGTAPDFHAILDTNNLVQFSSESKRLNHLPNGHHNNDGSFTLK